MRACFLGQNICALGFGVATLQTPPRVMDEPATASAKSSTADPKDTANMSAALTVPLTGVPLAVANWPRPAV